MQESGERDAMECAFNMTPAELGQVARVGEGDRGGRPRPSSEASLTTGWREGARF